MIRNAMYKDLIYIKILAEQYQQLVYGKIIDRTLDEINEIALVNGITYVFVTDKTVLGFITVEPDRAPPEVIFRLIVVHKHYQNKGIGHMLLSHALDVFRHKVCVLAIEKSNPQIAKLIKYYGKYGFIEKSSNERAVYLKKLP